MKLRKKRRLLKREQGVGKMVHSEVRRPECAPLVPSCMLCIPFASLKGTNPGFRQLWIYCDTWDSNGHYLMISSWSNSLSQYSFIMVDKCTYINATCVKLSGATWNLNDPSVTFSVVTSNCLSPNSKLSSFINKTILCIEVILSHSTLYRWTIHSWNQRASHFDYLGFLATRSLFNFIHKHLNISHAYLVQMPGNSHYYISNEIRVILKENRSYIL